MDIPFRQLNVDRIDLGECPIWDGPRRLVWFVDVLGRTLYNYDPHSGCILDFVMPSEVTCVGLAQGNRLVLGMKTGVHLFDPGSGQLDFLVHPEPDNPDNRLNDGRVGPDGCLWIGSMHDSSPRRPTGALYRVRPDGGCEAIRNGVCVSNGLAWSPDGRRMYYADSRSSTNEGVVLAYDFDPVGGVASRERMFAKMSLSDGLPDGAAVDADGCYWSAGVTAGCLNRFSPDGSLLTRIAVPVGAPTMPCFGGEALDQLFVTALTREQDGMLHEGAFLAAADRVPYRGIPEWRFGVGLRAA